MTKRLFIFFVFFSLFFKCTFTEIPEYIGLENIKVLQANKKTITLSANAHFKNPNDVGGQLQAKDLKIYINDTEAATLTSKRFDVPSKENFDIPLIVELATDRIINKKSLNGLLSSLISQQVKVQYKGHIDYTVLGYSSTYNVNETQDIKIKL